MRGWVVRMGLLGELAVMGACGDDGSQAGSTTTATTTGDSSGAETTLGESGSSGDTGVQPEVSWPHLACDPLVESLCALPFPSNVYTIDDPSTPTGRRVELSPEAAPVHDNGTAASPEPFGFSDGFSTGGALVAHLPGATTEGLASPLDIERSLQPESPTVLLSADDGQRVPHFAELDMSTVNAQRRAFLIRPVVPLRPATRYIVAIRDIVDGSGAPLPASATFAALRDDTPHDDPSVDARRPLYADIFARLDDAGVPRESLQLAWDFTTASRENDTAWMLSMRDDALELMGPDGPDYVITDMVPDYSEDIALRIDGVMSVPLYLDDPAPGGALVLDANGNPQAQGTTDVPFEMLVPVSATTTPAAVLQVGHGLLGSRAQVEAGYYQSFANTHNYVLLAVDWAGMSSEDTGHILGVIGTGEMHRFKTVVDRLQQGMINALAAMRMARGALADDPALSFGGQSAIDADTDGFYVGSSQGGILGAVYMALSTDVRRGILDVPGQPYTLLLNRSVDFDPFIGILRSGYEDPLDIQLLLGLAQMLWDRAEPAGYTTTLLDPLPGTPAKEILMQVAIGDHQVTTLGAHVMARAIGAENLGPVNREVWGIPVVEGSTEGAAMIEYDFGLPPEPIENVPMTEGEDPHGKVRQLDASVQTRAQFLATGVIETFCDGPCDPQ